MTDSRHLLDAELEHRIDVVSRPENQGESLAAADVRALLLATVLVPVVLLVIGWYA